MKKLKLLAGIIAMVFAGSVAAEVTWNGFITIAAGMTTEEDVTYSGYDNDISFDPESLYGIQASADIGDGWSVTSQLVGRADDGFASEFSWAYLSYEVSDQSRINIGRQRIPFYTYSDFLDVGYAYHWIRPPQSLYALGFSNVDGASWLYNTALGDWDSTFQLLYGRFNGIANPGGVDSQSDLRNVTSVAWGLSKDEWTMRFAYSFCGECFIDVEPVQPLIDGLNAAGLPGLASDVAFDGDYGYFADAGIKYDTGTWFIEGEYGKLEIEDTFQVTQESWYVSTGIRTETVTYHLTFEEVDDTPNQDLLARIPPPSVNPFFGLVSGFLAGQETDVEAVTVGMRFDVSPSVALKFDVTQYDNAASEDATVVALALTTVF